MENQNINGTRNEVRVMMGRHLKVKVVNVRKIKNRILGNKLTLEKEIGYSISMYAPQVTLGKKTMGIFACCVNVVLI